MSTMQERETKRLDWHVEVCRGCGNDCECRPGERLFAGLCAACNRPVPVPLVFASVDEDPASAGAAACGEAALWLLNHEISPSDVLSTLANTTVGGPLEMYPYGYTLTLLVEVPRYMVNDLTTPTPVQTVESVREMADALSRPRTTPPTTYAPTVAHD